MRSYVSSPRVFAWTLALSLSSTAAWAQPRRPPTPHESIERAMAPVREAIDAASPSDDERAALRDVLQRAETWAAELVEAQHRHDLGAIRDRTRRLAVLARIVAARVEALRTERQADAAEQAAQAAEATLVQRRDGAAP